MKVKTKISALCAMGVLIGTGIVVQPPPPATAAARTAAPATVIVSMNVHTSLNDDFKTLRPQTREAVLEYPPSLSGGISLQWGDGDYHLHVGATPQHPLHRGIFTGLNTFAPGTEPHDLWAGLQSYSFQGNGGRIEVLDIGADRSGHLTRFDILYQLGNVTPYDNAFGEIRMNEPEQISVVSPTANQLHWPTVGTHNPAVLASDSFHNTTDRPVTFGAAVIRGGSAADFRIRTDTCSQRTILPATDCLITVAYRPRAGGPRVSSLRVPVQNGLTARAKTLLVGLSGSAPLGSTSLTSYGNDAIDRGRVHTFAPVIGFGSGRVTDSDHHHRYLFTLDPESQQAHRSVFSVANLLLTSPRALRAGTFRTTMHGPPYGLDFDAYYDSCRELSGIEVVHGFSLDADEQPTYASIDFTQSCAPPTYGQPSAVLHGRLRYQSRKDRNAPSKPSRLEKVGNEVRWKKSTARDLQTTIVRISTGGRVTATTGIPLSVGSATSAGLPILRRGATYTIAAFSVDKTGNVSRPALKSFVY